MKFKKLQLSLAEEKIDEGLLSTIKKVARKVKAKLSSVHMKLISSIIPTIVGLTTITPVSIQAAIIEKAEELGLEIEADELVHMVEIVEHMVHIAVAHKEPEEGNIIKEKYNV